MASHDTPDGPGELVDTSVRGEDWYAEPLGARRFVRVAFDDVDLSETTSAGAVFQDCTFASCRLNASSHVATAFVGCTFRRTSFFDATLDGCKLTGSSFAECTLRPLRVRCGQWRAVGLRGAVLAGLDLTDLDLRESDLSMADLTATTLRGARLGGVTVREAVLDRADLRGATLDGVDLLDASLRGTRVDLATAVLLAELSGVEVDPDE